MNQPLHRKPSRPTLKAIADELGITSMTVSKSLRGIGRISEETRRLVRSKAEEIGYFSSKDRLFPPFVKGIGSSEHQLRILCPTVGKMARVDVVPYRNDMINGLSQTLESGLGEATTESFLSLQDMLLFLGKERFHGVVLSEPYPTRWVEAVRKLAPVIYSIGHDFQLGVDSVYFNEARAAALIANKLRMAGHRHLAWIGTLDCNAPFHVPDEEFSSEETADYLSKSAHGTRYADWLYLASQQPGLTAWHVSIQNRDWNRQSLADVVRPACRQLLALRPQPTAIVVVAPAVAREVIRQLEASGLRIPRDMSVVSYGVERQNDAETNRKLSGVMMPMTQVGALVPEVVQRRLAYPEGLPISIQLDAAWESGETICPPRS